MRALLVNRRDEGLQRWREPDGANICKRPPEDQLSLFGGALSYPHGVQRIRDFAAGAALPMLNPDGSRLRPDTVT
jgi:hypothetical protein